MTDAALARRTQRALTRSTSLWTRRLRATASASSRSALRVRTAAWRRAPRALRTAGLRALLATTGTTCRAGRVSRSRCAVRASGSLRTAPRRRARARLALRTSIKTPWVIVRRRASRSLRAARVSACRQTLRRHAVYAAHAMLKSTRTPPTTARRRASRSQCVAQANLSQLGQGLPRNVAVVLVQTIRSRQAFCTPRNHAPHTRCAAWASV